MNRTVKILIVEDDRKVAETLKAGLQAEHYSVSIALTGEDGYFCASSQELDLILLDVMLPGRSGLEILKTLRSQGIKTPVLLLTARDSVNDRVLGLDTGADDYLAKPFAFPELLARIRALLRRGQMDLTTQFEIADLKLDLVQRQVTRSGQKIELTSKEFDLLHYLIRNPGHIISREMLAQDVWKEPSRATPLDNVIDVHIARLRKKIDQDYEPRLIQTIRGVGFILRQDQP
jgi:DNA-binding response OmpR family regulator